MCADGVREITKNKRQEAGLPFCKKAAKSNFLVDVLLVSLVCKLAGADPSLKRSGGYNCGLCRKKKKGAFAFLQEATPCVLC